jgi:hypothetical protein
MKRKLVVGLMIAILPALLPGCGGEEVDVTPPVISDITVSNITENSAAITWTTDEPAKGYLEYQCAFVAHMGSMSKLGHKETDESTFHRVVLEEKSSSSTTAKLMWFQISAHDASGNIATTEEMSFTAPPHPFCEGEGDC